MSVGFKPNEEAWEARKRSLLRDLYNFPPEQKTRVTQGSTALVSLAGRNDFSGNFAARKRIRDEVDIIPIDPSVLRNKHTRTTPFVLQSKDNWTLKRVIPPTLQRGHRGRVCCIAVDPTNKFFATGSSDAEIKVWDVASGKWLTDLKAHNETVRGLSISAVSPYLFSCGEDRVVKCFDLEKNIAIRDFHGHRLAVNTIVVHPTLDYIATGSRDKTVRVWDIRTRAAVHVLSGHSDSVLSVAAQTAEPQLVSGGSDCFVYLWDLAAGKPLTRLTRHKKPVKSIVIHHTEHTMVSCAGDGVRKWKFPEGEYFRQMGAEQYDSEALEGMWCCGALNPQNDLAVGGEDGRLSFFDWGSHERYQELKIQPMKGSLEGEGSILCATFDVSGTQLLTGCGDKTIRFFTQKSKKQ